VRGPDYHRKTDVAKFQENIEAKMAIQQKKQAELADMEQEITILKRTETILKEMLREILKDVKNYEAKYGLTGLFNAEDDIEELTRKKGHTDLLKGKTLEELTQIVETLKFKIEEKRDRLKPLIEEHKNLKTALKEIEEDNKRKKAEYERAIFEPKNEYERIKKEYKEATESLYQLKITSDLYKEKTKVLGRIEELLDHESKCQKGMASQSKDSKTYLEAMTKEIAEKEVLIQQLKVKREELKEKTNNVVQQSKALSDLKFLMEEKLKNKKKTTMGTASSFKVIKDQYNRVVLE
jgi:myosin heavy subunit